MFLHLLIQAGRAEEEEGEEPLYYDMKIYGSLSHYYVLGAL